MGRLKLSVLFFLLFGALMGFFVPVYAAELRESVMGRVERVEKDYLTVDGRRYQRSVNERVYDPSGEKSKISLKVGQLIEFAPDGNKMSENIIMMVTDAE